MKLLIKLMHSMIVFAATVGYSQENVKKIAIIKADDVRSKTKKWERFFELSKEKGVKVSAGIICDSLEGADKNYTGWLKELNASGQVEFWNHGWDHNKWTDARKKDVSEFGGSGYDHQKKHFADAQAIMKQVLGTAPVAFGTPYNAVDADTVKVMNADEDLRLFFCYRPLDSKTILSAKMSLKGEHDGTGKPDFTKFKQEYGKKKDLSFAAIQFHPNAWGDEHFDAYGKILDLLLADGWTLMLPSEYVEHVKK